MQYAYCMQATRTRKPTISLRLKDDLLRKVDEIVRRARMKSRTEFIERAIEAYAEELREAKIVYVRPWSRKRAKGALLKFVRAHPGAYVSDVAEALGMDFELAFSIVDELRGEDRVERAPR